MRHLKSGKKFHRKRGQRKALVKNLMNNLILQEKVELTEVKAKVVRSQVEKLVTMGKKQNLASFRHLLSRLPKKSAEKIYYQISPRYQGRRGGYTRIIKMAATQKNNGARKAIVEFV